ncbi:hypothetical protein [Butyrivibrio sp. XBB1001]|uniref:hypothetical protein n=1 Tax=Butyrivibrio sp. XBB1001 TaxID=1280682 RepID=UPI00047A3D98|nr:hypothetical protein [Butyrivibrio sp. XBB1001]
MGWRVKKLKKALVIPQPGHGNPQNKTTGQKRWKTMVMIAQAPKIRDSGTKFFFKSTDILFKVLLKISPIPANFL